MIPDERMILPEAHQKTAPASKPRPRFFSEADCRDIAARVTRFAKGGGYTVIQIFSKWSGNVRWARNQISTSGESCQNWVRVTRNINGAEGAVNTNATSDVALIAASRQAERLAALNQEKPNSDLINRRPMEPYETPKLFSDATYQLDADHRASAAISLARTADAAGMLSAGYIEVAAHSMATFDTLGRSFYIPFTQAQYSVTVRDPKGTASGWAGVDWNDWAKIEALKLTMVALDKCMKSHDPVAVEPGRYTTILESQAVCDFIGQLVTPGPLGALDEYASTRNDAGPFYKSGRDPAMTRLGEKVVDTRITISADPMDPEIGFPPFDLGGFHSFDAFYFPVYHKVTWIDHGILTNIAYDREQGIEERGVSTGMPNNGAFRMSGGDTTIAEMIATTKRGLLVTRFDQVFELDGPSQLFRGYTRDGLWLIENGKVSKPVKNMVFTESILFALNNIDQLGVPERVFHPKLEQRFAIPAPVVVPPLKIRDFSFTALTDAV